MFPVFAAVAKAIPALAAKVIPKAAPSLLSKALPFLGNMAGNAATAAASQIGNGFGNLISDKINGVPSALSGAELGDQARAYMDAAYPGTTAWDRLGAGGAGSGSAISGQADTALSGKQELRRQSRELTFQSFLADKNNRAHIAAQAAALGPDAVQALINVYDGVQIKPYDTALKQSREKLPFEIRSLEAGLQRDMASAAKSQSESHINRLSFPYQDDLNKSEIHRRKFGSATSTTAAIGTDWGNSIYNSPMAKAIREGKLFERFNDKFPLRFNLFAPKFKHGASGSF